MPLQSRWISSAVIVALAVGAMPTGLIDTTAAAAPAPAATVLSAPAQLGYQRVAPWPAGSREPRSERGWTAVYLGDSMAVATTDELQAALPGWRVVPRNFGGTAPCDWAHADEIAELVAATGADLVVFSFIGNSITPCTGHRSGTDLLGAYRADLVSICRAAAPARCVAVGQPALGPDVGRTLPAPDEPTSMYRHHAMLGHWGFVDAGAATETTAGAFDPVQRDPDGVHFSESGASAQAATIAAYLRWVTTPAPAR